MVNWLRQHWQLLVITAALQVLWATDFVLPFRVLVVFFHELSHAVATWATAGEVVAFSVSPNESGYVMSRGGSRFWVLTSGYLGSLIIGAGLFLAAVRSDADKAVLTALGVVMVAMALFYLRSVFGFFFSLSFGAVMIAIALILPRDWADLFLRVVGLASMLYVPGDIIQDTILLRTDLTFARSDAHMLAAEFGGSNVFWGGLWFAVSVAVILITLRFALRAPSNISFDTRKKA